VHDASVMPWSGTDSWSGAECGALAVQYRYGTPEDTHKRRLLHVSGPRESLKWRTGDNLVA
jgi:hypothetical protein